MKRLYVILLAILFGLSRGIHEGMVMIMPWDSMLTGMSGVRGHAWFAHYHALSVAPYIIFALLVYMVVRRDIRLWGIVGALLLIWQFTEIGEALARQGNFVYIHRGAAYENLNIADIFSVILTGWQVYILSAIRSFAGTLLIIKVKCSNE